MEKPEREESKMTRKRWTSRKLICALVGAALPVLNDALALGLPTEAIITSVCSLFGYVISESVIDAQRARAKP